MTTTDEYGHQGGIKSEKTTVDASKLLNNAAKAIDHKNEKNEKPISIVRNPGIKGYHKS